MHMKKQQGFTLVEVITSLAIGMVILAALYAMVNMGQKSTANIERKVYAQQDARSALEIMSLEIEMASYNPRPDLLKSSFWKAPYATSGTTCETTGVLDYRGIQQATANAITVQMNISGNDAIGDNVNESITYAYNSTNQCIMRTLDCAGTSHAFLGNIPGLPRAVRVINTSEVPVFRYFNAQGTEIPVTSLPAGIPDIARIDITLWVETQDVDMNTGQRKQMIYSTSVIPRNHVISR